MNTLLMTVMGSASTVFSRVAILLCAFAVFTPVALTGSDAWSNGGYSGDVSHPDYGTHDWIAEAALELQTGNSSFLSSTYHTSYLLGTEAPDNPSYIGDTSEHHVYYGSSRDLQDDSSALRASTMYSTSLEELRSGSLEDAAFYAGAMTHYISDVGVFGHTMGSGTDWGSEAVHQDYESSLDSDIRAMDFPTIALVDKDAYNSTLELAFKTTFGAGGVKPNVWMDDNFDWTDSAYRACAFASVNEAVSSVAAAIHHLLMEWGAPAVENPDADGPTTQNHDSALRNAIIIGAAAVVAAIAVIAARAATRR